MKTISSIIISLIFMVCSFSVFAAPIDINTADAVTLQNAIGGIGAKKAQAIVEYRLKHGLFGSVDELTNVKGIGPKTLEKNRDNLMVASPAP
ncbi:MAG: helix-hairpin-helix domain-containing protein [Gammaproteobacteria bacterium]|nr:helix-hairpin-helix domain-containing protein [Gammaproteobacteria bacterium]